MNVFDTIADARAELDACRAAGGRVGLVPTMGFLHEGHVSLMEQSVADCDLTMTTIFVNPLQFAPDEDLEAYPRDLERDLALCDGAGVGVVLAPTVEEMYPQPMLTTVAVPSLAARLEGESRPTHFAGVCTVVTKLFNLTGPCHAYFGEKDFQQLAIVRRMALDLALPVEVVGCPTVREPDGLAKSSRNVYLSEEDREAAIVLQQALQLGRARLEAGERDAGVVRAAMADHVHDEPRAELDYVDVVRADTLEPLDEVPPRPTELRLLGAARVGRPRLIDNIGVTLGA